MAHCFNKDCLRGSSICDAALAEQRPDLFRPKGCECDCVACHKTRLRPAPPVDDAPITPESFYDGDPEELSHLMNSKIVCAAADSWALLMNDPVLAERIRQRFGREPLRAMRSLECATRHAALREVLPKDE